MTATDRIVERLVREVRTLQRQVASPTKLKVQSIGDAILELAADTSNTSPETRHPRIILKQDGGTVTAELLIEDDNRVTLVANSTGILLDARAGTVSGKSAITGDTTAMLPTAWTAVSLVGGWSNFAGRQTCQYRGNGDELEMRGSMAGGTITNNTLVFTLPVGFRPVASDCYPLSRGAGSNPYIEVETSGQGRIWDVSSNARLGLSAVRFSRVA